jgi:parallel beta-helix repeat protein
MAQGIGVWALTGSASPKISYNLIQGNFTGITILHASPTLDHNTIIENYIEDEANSGAGLYIGYSSAYPILTNNYIAFNYYGVSVVNDGQVNLGDVTNLSLDDNGYNVINDNTFNDVSWNIWNGTNHIIKAENNLWPGLDIETIDATLYDNEESGGGVVDFEPISSIVLGKGNIDRDQRVSILDVVLILESVLNDQPLYGTDFWAADISDDLEVDINDLVLLIDFVLNQNL